MPTNLTTEERRRGAARSARTRRVKSLEEHIRRVVDSMPPPTPEQIQRLRDLFPPVPVDDEGRAAA